MNRTLPWLTLGLFLLAPACTDTQIALIENLLGTKVHLGKWLTNMPLPAGAPQQLVFSTRLADEFGELTDGTLYLGDSLGDLNVVRTDGGANPALPEVTASLRILPGNQPGDVCTQGEQVGTATVTGDANFVPQAVTPETIVPSDQALATLNGGEFTVCLEATSTVDALLSLNAMTTDMWLDPPCNDPPQNLAGTWSGTYTCDNNGDGNPDEGGPITLVVVQNGSTAAYVDDGNAYCYGTVCANQFAHYGWGNGYHERGVLTLTGPTTMIKNSTWVHDADPGVGGVCDDQLTLQ